MPQSRRVQLSLICADETLYEGLIVPFKENKELHGLVLRLLSAYYYDGELRNAVDGHDLSEYVTQEIKDNTDQNMLFAEVRKTLTAMNFLASSAEDTLGGGIDDMLGMLNDVAKRSGGEASVKSDYGTSAAVIRYLPEANIESHVVDIKEPSDSDKRISDLENKIESQASLLEKMSKNLELFLATQNADRNMVTEPVTASIIAVEPTIKPTESAVIVAVNDTIVGFNDSDYEDSDEDSQNDSNTADSDDSEAMSILSGFLDNGIGFTERF